MDNKGLLHLCWQCQYYIVFPETWKESAVCVDHIYLSVAIPRRFTVQNLWVT